MDGESTLRWESNRCDRFKDDAGCIVGCRPMSLRQAGDGQRSNLPLLLLGPAVVTAIIQEPVLVHDRDMVAGGLVEDGSIRLNGGFLIGLGFDHERAGLIFLAKVLNDRLRAHDDKVGIDIHFVLNGAAPLGNQTLDDFAVGVGRVIDVGQIEFFRTQRIYI